MKTKTYKYGKFSFRAYHKTAGKGYEIGLTFDGQTLFLGNFVHAKEANHWWTFMNRELRNFSKRYWISEKAPKTWYKKFLSAHLYRHYYKYLDKCFAKYERDFTKTFTAETKRYKRMKQTWNRTEKATFKTKTAA